MKKMKMMARQGDVLIINERANSLRESTRKRLFGATNKQEFSFKTEKCLPLAYGEVSGHKHAIYDKNQAQLLVSSDVQETLKHLNVTGNAVLQHEEHDAIQIAEKMNAVLIQNEYQQTKIRRSMD